IKCLKIKIKNQSFKMLFHFLLQHCLFCHLIKIIMKMVFDISFSLQLRVWTQQGDWNSASFAGALAIVRNGKPFTDGEFIIKRIKDRPLSSRTVHDRTIMISNQIEATQVKDINAAQFFSLALDDMIARYVDVDTLREESLAVLPLKGTTRGEDIFKSFNEFAKEKNLPMDKLVSVCTDGAPCMVGENRGYVEALFKALLDEVGNSYPGLLLHSNVCWLSRGKVTFLEIKNVKHPELADTHQLTLLNFYYLVDMTGHLNHLNGKMQVVGNTILSLQQAVFAFENKLELFIADIETGRLLHFEKLEEFKDACTASDPFRYLDLQQLTGFTTNLLQSFKVRFGEFRERTYLFNFITHPHECAVDSTDLSYIPGVSVRDFELQAADLKASDLWVNKFKSLNEDLERLERQQAELASQHKWEEKKKRQPANQLILKTWNTLPVTFFTLQRQSFSHLKNIKTNLGSRLTDGSLNACMKLNLTSYQPDYKTISKTMQHQTSH
uniref:DUF4371 domain-containing protein n=1 Tax=Oryzias latipes TaxID=8090 RepID=A0A3P9HEE7_ORYLA